MDNKKWYKRISTCFWFFLAILPFVVAIIQFIGYHLTFNSGISSATDLADYHSIVTGSFDNILLSFLNNWKNYNISFIYDAFYGVFGQLGFSGNNLMILSGCFGWFASVYFIEVIVDFVIWLPRLIHSFMERWCTD